MVSFCPSFQKCNSAFREQSWSRKFAVALTVTSMLAIVVIIVALIISIYFTDTCIEVGLPTGLTIHSFSEITRISWKPPKEQRNCYVYYSLFYRIDGGDKIHVRAVHKLRYDISRIKACSTLAVELHGVSGSSGELTENYVFQQYTEAPVVVPAPIVKHSPHKEGIVVEWSKPKELENCRIQYMLDIKTDFGHNRRYTVIQEYFILQSNTYCFQIYFNIATIYNEVPGPFKLSGLVLPDVALRLQAEINDTQIVVKWNRHPKQVLCSLTYVVIYTTEGQKPVKHEVKKPTTTFNVSYCLLGSLTLNISYNNITYSSSINASYWPREMQGPAKLQILTNKTTRNATWEMQSKFDHCKFNYEIQVLSDLGVFNHTMVNTKNKFFVISFYEYCFKLKLKIRALILQIISPLVTSDQVSVDTHPPYKLQAVSSQSNNTLTVSWRDGKQKMCNLTYSLTYTVGSDVVKTEVDGLKKVLHLEYCANATIGIKSHDSAPPSIEVFVSHSEGNPTKLGPVQKIDVQFSGNLSTIKWNSPQHVKYCESLMYTVTGRPPDNVTNSCNGTTTCQMELFNFCPVTIFNIASITYPGSAVAVHTYKCPGKH